MSKTIKGTASFFGADLVGITELNQAHVYSHRGRHTDVEDGRFGEEINNTHKFAIVIGYEMDYERIKQSPGYFTDAETGRIYAEVAKTAVIMRIARCSPNYEDRSSVPERRKWLHRCACKSSWSKGSAMCCWKHHGSHAC